MAYLKVDGVFGKTTKKIFQRYMFHYGWYPRTVDGVFGPQSWMGVQRMLKYFGRYSRYIDGDPGPYTWNGLNDFLGFDFSGANYMPDWNAGWYAHSWTKQLVKGLQHGLNVHYVN